MVTILGSVLCCVVYRRVRNISRGEEGRVLPEDLHRILGETCWEPIRTEHRWRLWPFSLCVCHLFGSLSPWHTHSLIYSICFLARRGHLTLLRCSPWYWSTTSNTNLALPTTVRLFTSEGCVSQTGTVQRPVIGPPNTRVFFFLYLFFSQQQCSRFSGLRTLNWGLLSIHAEDFYHFYFLMKYHRNHAYANWHIITVHVPNSSADHSGFLLYTVTLSILYRK